MKQVLVLLGAVMTLAAAQSQTFRVGAYNVENYLNAAENGRPAKSSEAKAKVREMIKALNADVLALEEMGNTNALLELRDSLKKDGVDYPHWEHVTGSDPSIHVAVLSKYPFTARHPHTNDSFLLSGKRFQVGRGFAEVEISPATNYSFTLFVAHLKSKRPVPEADQAELRLEEAKILREKIETRLKDNPNANIAVVGDFNDTKDTKPIKSIIGIGKNKLVDTRPAERNGDTAPAPQPYFDPPHVTWTHFYGKEDTYSRIDYILLSPAMAREWIKADTYVLAMANWAVASDHRPVVATFSAVDK